MKTIELSDWLRRKYGDDWYSHHREEGMAGAAVIGGLFNLLIKLGIRVGM